MFAVCRRADSQGWAYAFPFLVFFTHTFLPNEVLSFHPSCDDFTYCLILISIEVSVNVMFGGIRMVAILLNDDYTRGLF